MNLNPIDLVVLVLVLGSAVWGAFKGFVSQIVSIAALLVGVWCAYTFSHYGTEWFKDLIPGGRQTIYILTFIIILGAVIILGYFLGKGIEKIIRISMLGWLNRLLGVLFSALKTIIILSIIVYLIDSADRAWHILPDGTFSGSRCYHALERISSLLFPYLKELIA